MTLAEPRKRGRPPQPGLAESRREQILAAATDLFARHGFEHTDLQQVADVLGVGKGTVYRYFPSKRELFLAAADRAMHLLHGAVAAAADPSVYPPLERIERAITAYLVFFEEHPEFVELFIQERAAFRDRPTPTYFAHRQAQRERWRPLYDGLIESGVLRHLPAERIMDAVSAMVYGAMFTNFFLGRTHTAAQQARELLDVLFHGVLKK